MRLRQSILWLTLAALALAGNVWAANPEASRKSDPAGWDVNDPPGSVVEIEIDTREGTWMSVDVSPDGQWLVFDLLGDIYVLPIVGGEAKALTSGMAWDIQPRFSPDGRHIAFISDRTGGDNLWIMGADGTGARQVSHEDFRLVHNPAWTPDGHFLAVRKHFTGRRSLGAGEIWLYHHSGGDGLQLVEKLNHQKDINEPAFSPDGRYLYFSVDRTPGDTFEYNRDANGEIYEIRRLDRETGRVDTYIKGPGGAVRPAPSPDGSRLAFVRRHRGQSVLVIKDLASGVETTVFGKLDRDNQEIWAIHGLYPNMAWMADGQSLVFWAAGKLQRLHLADQRVEEIPFHVKTSLAGRSAVRSAVEVAPPIFPTRMLRWVTVSPDGQRVVYQALGHLYIKDLPDGEPRRLTVQDEHFEHHPTFSRDGQWVAYTTWDDQELGSVRVVPAEGGRGTVLTPDPGHYVQPVFSPDGQTVVFRKLPGNRLLSPWWGQEPGLYEISTEGGQPDLLTRDGHSPQFGESSDYLYFQRDLEDKDDTYLQGKDRSYVRRDLSTGEETVLLESKHATQFRLSPDGRWIAFNERFNAYLAPLPGAGKTIRIGPDSKSLPLQRVSRDAGDNLHWAGDSKRLYWSLGAQLHWADLQDGFAVSAPGKSPGNRSASPGPQLALTEKSGLPIGFDAALDIPEGTVALTGVRVITMNEDEVIEDAVVLIEGNRIKAVGPRVDLEIPEDAELVFAGGTTVMPGIVDVHWHGKQGADGIIPEQNWVNFATLAFGVTTIHDPSHDTNTIFATKELARAGLITAPRIFSTGTILYGATTEFTAEIDSPDEALANLRRLKAVGAESVKSYNQPRRNQRQQVLAAARKLGLNVFAEGGALFQANMTMIVDGHTGIEHCLPVADVYDDVMQLWPQTAVGYTPTLVVAYGGIWGEQYWYQHSDVYAHERLMRFVPREIVDPVARRRSMAPEEEYNHVAAARVATRLSRAGVPVLIGAHGQREGLGAHWEMWMLAQGGMSAREILRAATIRGARYLGMEAEIGSIEAGKLADLIVLEKNPLDDIRNSERIRYVIVNGRIFDARTMHQLGRHPREREPFYWER